MIELIIMNHLKGRLDVPVRLEHPSPATGTYVLIEKVGSGRTNQLENSTIAFQSYADSLYEAASLNQRLKIAVFSLLECDEISRIDLNSDYNFTDTETKRYRYQAVFDIYHY